MKQNIEIEEQKSSMKTSIIEYEEEIEDEYESSIDEIERTNSEVIDRFMAEEEQKEPPPVKKFKTNVILDNPKQRLPPNS